MTRGGGKVGDRLFVTGRLGGSFESGRHLDFIPRIQEGMWLACYANAMMDLSDGLQRDLPRLAKASALGFEVDLEALPLHENCTIDQALGDGEDMELLFSTAASGWEEGFRLAFPEVEITCIGRLVQGGETDLGDGGWEHFTKEDA